VSVVYFTRDLSAAGLRKAAAKVLAPITGKQAIKLHTGEKNGPNIIPREWVAEETPTSEFAQKYRPFGNPDLRVTPQAEGARRRKRSGFRTRA
jgi:hypothetical protein